MDMTVKIEGLKQTRDNLKDLAKKVPSAASMAINTTAYDTMMVERKEIADSFDRPTPIVQRGVKMNYSNQRNLESVVYVPGKESNFDASAILFPNIMGGPRLVKASERRLRRFGFMRSDQFIVPGPAAPLDQYGNISGPTMVKILSQISAFSESGYDANARIRGMSWKRYRQLGAIYVIPTVGVFTRLPGAAPGNSNRSVALLLFTNRTPEYDAERFDFFYVGENFVNKNLERNFDYVFLKEEVKR